MANASEDEIAQEINEAIQNGADSLSLFGHYNNKDQLPKTLLDIPRLRHLFLSHFHLDMPAWLTDIASLESLEIEETRSIREIVPLLWKLKNLRKLMLAYVSDLNDLPSSLAMLEHLETLNIDGADFTKFPQIIASLHSLQSFSLKYCDCALPEVFDILSSLPRLKILRLTHFVDEGGDSLPESFYRLQAIEELHFNDWIYLQELPEYIGTMRTLRVINVSNDDYQSDYDAWIKELPDSLCDLCNLEELNVYGLQDLKRLPPNFSRLSRLKRLNTMCSGIEELQLTPEQWGNLETLRMHGPLPDLQLCVNLKKFTYRLGVSASGIPHGTNETITMPLSPPRKLESLSITGGALVDTSFLASLINLRRLHLNCDFENFPAGFEKLDKLEEINIWCAKSLSALPEYLGYLPSLKSLCLTGCGVKSLPKSVRERKDLLIDVRHCPVQWPE